MTRATIAIYGKVDREKAKRWIDAAPTGTRVDFKASKRSLPQNAKMWVMLTELAEQVTWHGQRLTPDDWKLVMLDGLKRELRIVPNIDGNGFVNLGRSSSDLSKDEMADLITLIEAFGLQHGVAFGVAPHDEVAA